MQGASFSYSCFLPRLLTGRRLLHFAWCNQSRLSASVLLLPVFGQKKKKKKDICDIFFCIYFLCFLLFFIFLSGQRHKRFIFLLKGCVWFEVCILYISGFNLHTPFYLKKNKKNNLHYYDATTAHKGTFTVECARACVCVFLWMRACMHLCSGKL